MNKWMSVLLIVALLFSFTPQFATNANAEEVGETVQSVTLPEGSATLEAIPVAEPEKDAISPEESIEESIQQTTPAFIQTTAAEDIPAIGDNEVIPRSTWIQMLVSTFDMVVEEAHAPDNYFSDLTGEEEYYRDILVAVQFGVVDIPAGEAFMPKEATTREFAAQTLNTCLGFQLDEKEIFTFIEANEVTYPVAIQVAINRGWFALSNGKLLPQQAVTGKDGNRMLADAEAVLASRVIDVNYKNSYEFAADVIEIPDGTEVEIFSDTVTIYDCPETISVGDVLIVWYSGVPCAYIAKEISVDGNATIIVGTSVDDDGAIITADAQGMLNTEFAQFVPAEGTEVVYVDEVTGTEYTDAKQADRAVKAHRAQRGTKKLMTLQLKNTINLDSDTSISISVKLKDPILEYKFSTKDKSASVILTADYEFSLSGKANVTEKKLRLGFWGAPGVGGIEIVATFSLSGTVTGTFSGTMSVGLDYSSGSGFSIPRTFYSKGFSLSVEATLKAGLKVDVGINDVPKDLISGYVYAEIGAKGTIKRTVYDEGEPRECVNTAIYLYLECGAKLSFKLSPYKSEYSKEYKIWKESNSPVRVVHHYENGKEVCECTRGAANEGNGYYTVGTSNYWSCGWSGGSGSTGYDRYGNPVTVYTYTLDENNNATITGYSGGGAAITIPATIDGYVVTSIGYRAFGGNTKLSSVRFSDAITTIGSNAFCGCTLLSTVTLPPNLTEIGSEAFAKCTALSEITIPKTLASTLSSHAYGAPFVDSGLKYAILEEGMTKIPSYLFEEATKLESVKIPNTVTTIGSNAFYSCTSLSSITLPPNLTEIDSEAFAKCTALSEITIPKTLASTLSSHAYGAPFADSGLKYAVLEEGMTKIPDALFKNSKDLIEVRIPNTVTVIQEEVFYNCTSLSIVTLPPYIARLDQEAFGNCKSLTEITIPKTLTDVSWTYPNHGPFCGSGIVQATIEEGVTRVPDYLFEGASQLEEVSFAKSTVEIGKEAFRETGFREFAIPNTIYIVGNNAFSDCTSLERIVISDSVTEMGTYVFSGCTSLTDVKLPDIWQSIPVAMFKDCTAMEEINIPRAVINISGKAFYGCTSLRSIHLPENVQTIKDEVFYNCDALTVVSLNHVLKSIGNNVFYDCDALESITIPNSVTSIGNEIFAYCDSLKNITTGTGLTVIPQNAFFECPALTKIELSYQIKEIKAKAFGNCTGLKKVTILRYADTIATNAFSYPDILTIYGVAGTTAETYAAEIGAKFVAIDVPATAVSLNQTQLTMSKGASATLVASITPTNFTDEVAWKSSNTSVATVTDAGVVKAVGIGECTISFVAGNVKATCKVSVVQPVTSISLNKTSLSLDAGTNYTLTATVNPSNAANKTIVWSSDNENVATVDQNGVVTALSKGTATITVAAQDGSGVTKNCKVTVLNNLYVVSSVEELESTHPYATNANDIWQYSIPGATALEVTFDTETSVEEGSDYIYVYSEDGTLIGTYTGTELAGQTITVPGDTVRIKLVSDSTYCEYGFAVAKVKNADSNHAHEYSSTEVPPTCTEQGYTIHICSICDDSYKDTYTVALGHSYSYKNNGETHTATCGRCTDSFTAAHGYTGGECVCGATQYVAPTVDQSIVINHTLNLASDISVNYAVKGDLLVAYDSYHLEVQVPTYSGNVQTGTTTVRIQPVQNGGYYYFTLTGITAVQMNDPLLATLHMSKGGKEYVSNADSYGIAVYAYNQLNKSNASKALKTLCADLLRYGAAAQTYKGYRTDALATDALTAVQQGYLSDLNAVTFGNTNTIFNDLSAPMITWAGKALNLDSKVVVKFIFDVGAYTGDLSNLTLRLAYRDNAGTYRTATLTNPGVYDESKRLYAFDFDGLMAAELRTALSATVYAGSAQVSRTLQYSADTYGNNKTGTLLQVCKALFAYSDSAKAYFVS